jgi:DNA/RNA-binding protein KIN17
MCDKQCRDENGFKCHLTSDSHKRQMEVLGQNPARVIEGYSEMFENSFLEHLRRCHPFSRVHANSVYNEYIQDK